MKSLKEIRGLLKGGLLVSGLWLFIGMDARQSPLSVTAAEPQAIAPKLVAISAPASPGDQGTPLATARERAALAHTIYATTMDVIHHHYFRRGQAVLPARALEEIFAEVAEQTKIEGRWIAVNTKAMSINHEPKTDFEKRATTALAAGEAKFELIEKDYYRSARPIPLGEGCVSCHTGFFRGPAKSPRFAGLVISIPLK